MAVSALKSHAWQQNTILSQTIILLSVGVVMAAAGHAGIELILRRDRFSIIGTMVGVCCLILLIVYLMMT